MFAVQEKKEQNMSCFIIGLGSETLGIRKCGDMSMICNYQVERSRHFCSNGRWKRRHILHLTDGYKLFLSEILPFNLLLL